MIGQQVEIKGKRIDILFEDKLNRHIIVEIKRGLLTREAPGQVMEYYGLLKGEEQERSYELILCANVIPPERTTYLENSGIGCKAVPAQRIREVAAKYNYSFIDDQPKPPDVKPLPGAIPPITDQSEDVSVWIFQANPNIYDVMNALDDDEIGNLMHWTVNQNAKKIHKGHLVLLWMSGPEAGIYALARVESEPGFMKEIPSEKKYWFDKKGSEVALYVRMSIIRRFVNQPILRKTLMQIPELSQLSILKQSQGTNFAVRDSEWMIINSLM